ncbi:MAG TPA: permease-like cell division protein FtsX [Rudaea sp.]
MNRRKTPNRLKPAPAAAARPAPRARIGWNAWREQHLYSLFSSLGRIAARPWATVLTLLVMSLAMALPLLLWLALDNARQLGGGMQDARAVSVFLKTDVDANAAKALAQKIGARREIAQVVHKTPEQGLEEFRNQSGFADALKLLQSNPLPSVLIATPNADTPAPAIDAMVAELRADPLVDQVQYDAQWRQRLDAILLVATRGALALAVLLALGTLLIVGNTVRLDIQGRAEEIAVMQLLGASNGFVRRPFLYAGFWYGAGSALLALLLIVAVELALAGPIARLLASYDHRFDIHELSILAALAVFAGGSLLGWIGAWLATSRHMAAGHPAQ